jgi:hypothetical protein
MATIFVSNAGSGTAPYDTEAKAATTLGVAITAATSADTIKVSSTHTETAGAAISYTLPTTYGLKVLSVLFNGSGTGALTQGGTVNVGAANAALTFATGYAYFNGLSFVSGTNNNAACDINVISATIATGSGIIFDACTLSVPSASTTALINLSLLSATNGISMYVEANNCTFSHGAVKSIFLGAGRIKINNCTLTGTAPTTIFNPASGSIFNAEVTNCDFSGLAWTNLFNQSGGAAYGAGNIKFISCKLRSGFTPVTGTSPGLPSYVCELIDCHSGDTHYYYSKTDWAGSVTAQNSIYSANSDGTNSFAWVLVSTANASFTTPLTCPPILFFNSTLSAMTTTVEVINDGTTFKDDELWQETTAKTSSGFPLGVTNIADRAADILTAGANQTTSTASWTGTGGFGAAVKQKLVSGSFTPAEVGLISTVVKLAKASATVYVDMKVLTDSGKQYQTPGVFLNERSGSSGAGAGNIRSGVSEIIDGVTINGTLTLPPENKTQVNYQYGAAGTEYTGTLEPTLTTDDIWGDSRALTVVKFLGLK